VPWWGGGPSTLPDWATPESTFWLNPETGQWERRYGEAPLQYGAQPLPQLRQIPSTNATPPPGPPWAQLPSSGSALPPMMPSLPTAGATVQQPPSTVTGVAPSPTDPWSPWNATHGQASSVTLPDWATAVPGVNPSQWWGGWGGAMPPTARNARSVAPQPVWGGGDALQVRSSSGQVAQPSRGTSGGGQGGSMGDLYRYRF